jgi:hypothetical protein
MLKGIAEVFDGTILLVKLMKVLERANRGSMTYLLSGSFKTLNGVVVLVELTFTL